MKTIRKIQKVAAVLALLLAISLVDKEIVNYKDAISAIILGVLGLSVLIESTLRQEMEKKDL